MILSSIADCLIASSLLTISATGFTPSNINNGIRLNNIIGAGNYGALSIQQQQQRPSKSVGTSSTTTTSTTLGMFDQLSSAITEAAQNSFGNSKKQRMTETSIQPALKSVRRALLDADVNLDVAAALIDGVKRRSLGVEVTQGVTAEQQFVKAMYDELLDVMGGRNDETDDDGAASKDVGMMGSSPTSQSPTATLAYRSDVDVDGGGKPKPAVILLAGLQGAGKTTAAGKLALYLKEREVDPAALASLSDEERSKTLVSRLPKRRRRVLLCAADVYRPAAIEQLQILGGEIGVDVFAMGKDVDPAEIARRAVEKATEEGYDTVVVDTAGRQVVDEELMEELRRVKRTGECFNQILYFIH